MCTLLKQHQHKRCCWPSTHLHNACCHKNKEGQEQLHEQCKEPKPCPEGPIGSTANILMAEITTSGSTSMTGWGDWFVRWFYCHSLWVCLLRVVDVNIISSLAGVNVFRHCRLEHISFRCGRRALPCTFLQCMWTPSQWRPVPGFFCTDSEYL